MTHLKALGTTDDFLTCDCCGREGLKKTVIMAEIDADGNRVGTAGHFGVVCAAKASGRSAADIRKEAAKADKEAKTAEQQRRHAIRKEIDAIRDAVWMDMVGFTSGSFEHCDFCGKNHNNWELLAPVRQAVSAKTKHLVDWK